MKHKFPPLITIPVSVSSSMLIFVSGHIHKYHGEPVRFYVTTNVFFLFEGRLGMALHGSSKTEFSGVCEEGSRKWGVRGWVTLAVCLVQVKD